LSKQHREDLLEVSSVNLTKLSVNLTKYLVELISRFLYLKHIDTSETLEYRLAHMIRRDLEPKNEEPAFFSPQYRSPSFSGSVRGA